MIDTSTIVPANGYINLVFPPTVTLSSTANCNFYFGFSGAPTCTPTGNTLKVWGSGVFPSQNGI